jgi:hypothetical protein
MRDNLEIAFHVNADKSTVKRLAADYGSTLIAAVRANRAARRPPIVYWVGNGYILAAMTSAYARKQGVQTKPFANFYVLGMPDDNSCPVVRHIRQTLGDDPTTRMIPADRL